LLCCPIHIKNSITSYIPVGYPSTETLPSAYHKYASHTCFIQAYSASALGFLTFLSWHKILLRLLHIKIGPIINFVKAMDRTGSAFKYLAKKFPPLSKAKIKEGIFVGPQISKPDMFNNLHQNEERNS
jgi:hypothetical protein